MIVLDCSKWTTSGGPDVFYLHCHRCEPDGKPVKRIDVRPETGGISVIEIVDLMVAHDRDVHGIDVSDNQEEPDHGTG